LLARITINHDQPGELAGCAGLSDVSERREATASADDSLDVEPVEDPAGVGRREAVCEGM